MALAVIGIGAMAMGVMPASLNEAGFWLRELILELKR
ncbi:hypothetical protein GGD56_005976 [Rhizobium mongolense]|uniref:Uncharacterized protein n=1 Tax=Rhizobium mongolense TaxID=57676 RepID=A0ABR6IX17_9HYPH|nr:hypothetical protein [Rhizobium mongolense]